MVMKIMQATVILAISDGTKCNGKQCERSNFIMKDWLAVLWKMAQDAPKINVMLIFDPSRDI